MKCPPDDVENVIVMRSNYGDASIAMIQHLLERREQGLGSTHGIVVYIETGWAARDWWRRVEQGEQLAKRAGFETIRLRAMQTFSELVLDRKGFPSSKFQWCAGFLKGLPFLDWLDERDPRLLWTIAIPKRQAFYAYPLAEVVDECEFHGQRRVWHPLHAVSDEVAAALIMRAGFEVLGHRSLECDPCVNSHADDLQRLSSEDREKVRSLEEQVGQRMFVVIKKPHLAHRSFSMGCGDPFGCGL